MLKFIATPTHHAAIIPSTAVRTNHGGNAWALPDSASTSQPQDGVTHDIAVQRRYVKAMTKSQIKSPYRVSSVVTDPEDARLTGGTRSLMRRLLGLNLRKAGSKGSGRLKPAQAA